MSHKINTQLFPHHDKFSQKEACPDCGESHGGVLELKYGKHGAFLGCHRYPDCNYIKPIHSNDGHIVKLLGVTCPTCQQRFNAHKENNMGADLSHNFGIGELVLRQGRYGMFIGCSEYPSCHHIESTEKTIIDDKSETDNITCPQCHKGKLIHRRSRYGKAFYACDAYPKCRFAVNFMPVAKTCKTCGFELLVEKQSASGVTLVCASRHCQAKQS